MYDDYYMENLSVLMPARNEEKTILGAVRSVLVQLTEGDELIVFDDSSSDGTLSKLKTIKDKRLRIIRGETQIGTSAAANLLNQAAANSLVAKLDADDYALPGRFRFQRSEMDKKNLDFHFGCSLLKRGLVILPQPPKKLNSIEIANRLVIDNPLTNSTMMARKEAIDELGGYPEGSRQDYSLWLRAALGNKSMERSARYLVMREIPLRKDLSEARNKPVASQIEAERVSLYRFLNSQRPLSVRNSSSDDEILNLLNSEKIHRFRIVEFLNKHFG